MKNKKNLVLSAVGALAFASIAVGTTFALFTSKAETNIEVNSGIINVNSNVEIISKKSALYDPNGDYDVDPDGNKYTSQDGWVNGGDAEVVDGNLSLHEMTPGDKVDFKVQMKNNSNVACKYRFVLEVEDKSSLLASGLRITLNNVTYEGLLSYSSDWKIALPEETPEYSDLVTASIYLPMDRGNVFQNLSTTYKLSVETVQGNAYTNNGESYETASYLPQETVLNGEKKASVVYGADTASETAVNLDLSANPNYKAGQSIILGVNNVDVVENSFVVSGNDKAAAAIDLNLFINNAKVTNGFEAKIATKVATGLDNSIKVYYPADPTAAFGTGGERVNSLEELDTVGEFYYNQETGDLVFITNHFSDYVVSANNIKVYNKTAKIAYVSFKDAIANSNTGDVISLLNDLDLRSETPAGDSRLFINKTDNKDLTIDGLGHVVKIGGRGFGIQIEKTTFRNVDIVNTISGGRCIDTRPDGTHPVNELNLDNVTLETSGGSYDQPLTIGGNSENVIYVNIKNCNIAAKKYYAIISFNQINCKIEDSVISGWACLYLKGPSGSKGSAGSTITINNSTLTTSNPYGGNSNSFASIMCEDTSGRITLSADNSTFNVTALTTESWQSLFGGKNMYDASINNSVINLNGDYSIITFSDNGSTFSYDENTVVYIDGEVASEEQIQDRIFIE